MPRIHYIMSCSTEPAAQVAWALARLRFYNPGATVTLVVDRKGDRPYGWVADLFETTYEQLPDAPQRLLQHGGKWVHSWMTAAIRYGGYFEQLIKMDPDTFTNGPVQDTPDAEYFGFPVARFGLPVRNLGVANHGAVGFSRRLVDKLVGRQLYLDKRFYDGTARVEQSPGSKLASEEILTAYILRDLAIPVTPWKSARHGVQSMPTAPPPGLIFMHSVLPFDRDSLGPRAPWYIALLDAEEAWFRATWGSRCPADALP